MRNLSAVSVYSAQFLIGGAELSRAYRYRHDTRDCRGRCLDQAFRKKSGIQLRRQCILLALLVAYVRYKFGIAPSSRFSALLAIPAAASLLAINPKQNRLTAGREEQSKKKARRGDVLTPEGPCSSFLPGERFSFSFSQRRDVAATG